ncbi:hypothetical protein [Pararhodobacter aggregans]|uniref:hypothetical protein n=1 Tax=Pararhodobacter aggregans TaxID=404875 RepID=UPI003A94733B
MQFKATRDFVRQRAQVLDKFRNPARFEEVMEDMNVAARRTAEAPDPGWDCAIHWHEAERRFTARMQEPAPGETLLLSLASDLADAAITLDFQDRPEGGCRVTATADISAHTVLARLALQSLRLVRGKGENRLTRLIAALGRP